jgi:SAM-dependent methyltransferase
MPFRDHFSKHADDYARYRPSYPDALFDYLAERTPGHKLAWDCGTGSGQAAIQLAERFEHVIATDASREQIEHAFPHASVEYRVEPAEQTSIESGSVDLITVGVAVHWFDFEPFFKEVCRVTKPGALLAVWTYSFPEIIPAVDRVIERYYYDVLSGYWPERIRHLEARYRSLPFPFKELQPPEFFIEMNWDLNDLLGFVGSWSSTRRYIEKTGSDPLDLVREDFQSAWGRADEKRPIRWLLHTRIGKIDPTAL